MKVLKFGGTSVGTAASIRNVRNIISAEEGEKLVVLSAMSGVTNKLVTIAEAFRNGITSEAHEGILELESKHQGLVEELFSASEEKQALNLELEYLFEELRQVVENQYHPELEPVIITFGETFLTFIFSRYLESAGLSNTLLNAREFMHIANRENPDTEKVGRLLAEYLSEVPQAPIYITQGFVCRDGDNKLSTLKRGGSDYSATIIAAAIKAEEVQIWTDIDGFHNNDPRYVENTAPISHLSYEEAAELAYFGAKILHPQTVSPVKNKNIDIYLKNTFEPNAVGTRISSEIHTCGLKAISAKDGITAINIKSNRMLMAHGFLRKIFEVFDNYRTPIDMITTSEIAISLTIDDDSQLNLIEEELRQFGEISIDREHSIICVVGEELINDAGSPKIFEILKEIPVRMISYGGSNNNISLLVDTSNKAYVLQRLHTKLFEEQPVAVLS